ncbi:MAG: prepilin-type N-terminal cleavage/methylation domain-containing protein [Planctomycetes bacterium]|nr:prepilin-type N-terminal cleavage/methylation domain-containing protein [Planctomycetota bacterium]
MSDKTSTRAFTLVEVVAAVALLAILLSSVLVVMNNFVDAVIDMRLRQQAFDLARTNMETLLSESRLSDMAESGISETNPDIRWETVVEPFYEPINDSMWVRAVCSAVFIDSKNQDQTIELEHWVTNLTAAQVKQILEQQQIEAEYLDLLQADEYTDIQQATIAYLEQADLDAGAYIELIEQQRRQRLEYLDEKGFNDYEEFAEQLQEEENEFLEELGMDFDEYNDFASTYSPSTAENPETEDPDIEGPDIEDPEIEDPVFEPDEELPDTQWDWDNIPKELWPLIEQLTGAKPPSQ